MSVQLDFGNVSLKPTHKKWLMASLKRSLRLGQRIGDFFLRISVRRAGNAYTCQASVHDHAGDFICRSRAADWRSAFRDLIKSLSSRLHDQYVLHPRLA